MSENVKKEIVSWVKSILFSLVLIFIFQQFLFAPVTVKGESMMPTFEDSNRLIVNKINKIHRFDFVVFHAPDADKDYIKRVIGLPGDRIEVKNDILHINGKKYNESYLNKNKSEILFGDSLTEDFTKVVPKGTLFVMGDNRQFSKDSRFFGPISEDSVVGKVQFRYYPFVELGTPN